MPTREGEKPSHHDLIKNRAERLKKKRSYTRKKESDTHKYSRRKVHLEHLSGKRRGKISFLECVKEKKKGSARKEKSLLLYEKKKESFSGT